MAFSRYATKKTISAALLLSLLTGLTVSLARDPSGPIFYDGEQVKIEKYTFKEKKKRSKLTPLELAWLLTASEDNPEPPTDIRLTQEEKTAMGIEIFPEDPFQVDLTPSELNRDYLVMDVNAAFIRQSKSARYLYTGNAPRFTPERLEIFVSKLGLTVRVKGWVDQAMMDNYEYAMLTRWSRIMKDFGDPVLSFEPLKNPETVLSNIKDKSTKNWMKVAIQYMRHTLLDTDVSIYDSADLGDEDYKKLVLKGMLREILNNKNVEIADGFARLNLLADPLTRAQYAADSRNLFMKNLGAQFTPDVTNIVSEVPSVGYLTFVYPIAASKNGPYNQPSEGLYQFGGRGKTYGGGRWMSDFWGDEYGGMPFMEVADGVGFHGPITSKDTLNLWYFQRGYVSHGCFRMDPSDVMEFRSVLPTSVFGSKQKPIPMRMMQFPDVADLDNSGTPRVIDVKYYFFQSSRECKIFCVTGRAYDRAVSGMRSPNTIFS